jgi:hypothetical protein
MTKLSPEIEARGLLAYEQARAFEAQRSRLPFIYGGMTLIMAILVTAMVEIDHSPLAGLCVLAAILFPTFLFYNWRRLKARHDENMVLLTQLHAEYGDDLPWLQVERHLAALDQLQKELARENRTPEVET